MTSKQNDHLSPDLDSDLKWNARAVQALIDDSRRRGETPVVLCLGQLQAAALKAHLSTLFEDGVVTSLKNQVYAGLKIVELKVDSHLRIETLRSIYDNSRHAEQARIRDAMARNHLGDSNAAPPAR